jgi:hypothetical protein
MNKKALADIEKWFTEFTDEYRGSDGSLHACLQLKLDHSKRVAADCRGIARDLGWPRGDVMTAEALGLLHDISRFPQHKEYGTFLDYRSFDHGERGYRIMSKARILRRGPDAERKAILYSIRYHNRRTVNGSLDPLSARFLKLIRDADKLDILRVVHETIRNNLHKDYPEILCNVRPDGPPNPALLAEIRKHGAGSYKYVKSMTDMNVMRITWVYNINYLPSLQRLSRRGLLNQLDEVMPDYPEVVALMESARRFVRKTLGSKRRNMNLTTSGRIS